ncbi:MAG: hypothetical protein V3T17_09110 [Pseudomonadales bacterium]
MNLPSALDVKRLCLSVAFVAVTACGGGGSSTPTTETPPPQPPTAQGIFLDSAVEGLRYVSGGQSGLTDANGTFTYEVGASVTFTIGDIEIGTAQGAAILTPLEFVPTALDESDPMVVNILRFLQTLDDDGDPDNGIQITELVRDLAAGLSITFNQSIDNFTGDGNVQVIVSDLTATSSAGARLLIDASIARAHFRETLDELNSGNGNQSIITLSGDDTGALGKELTLTEFGYRPDFGGAEEFLAATSDGVLAIILPPDD